MTYIYKILITVSILLLSLPVLAGVDTVGANSLTSFIKENSDIIKHLLTLLVAFIAVFGTVKVAKIAREAPNSATKLDQMKFIDSLIIDKAWKEDNGRFIVEEAFLLYYKRFIPVEIIVLLTGLDARFYAFSSYLKVSNLTSFNRESGKIKSLTTLGKCLYIASISMFFIVLLHVASVAGVISYSLLMNDIIFTLNIIVGIALAVISAIFLYCMCALFNIGADVFPNFSKFEKDAEGYIEKTEIRNTDFLVIIVLSIIIGAFWLAMYFMT